MNLALAATMLALIVCASACGSTQRDPQDLTFAVAVRGCGAAESSEAVAVAIDEAHLLVSAHVVLQAGAVELRQDDTVMAARVARIDRERDLALVVVEDDVGAWATFGEASEGEPVQIVASRLIEGLVVRVLPVRIQEAGGIERHTREGLELDETTSSGESGAGVWNGQAELVGVIFGHRTDAPFLSYATAASEIETFLSETSDQVWVCDASTSHLVVRHDDS